MLKKVIIAISIAMGIACIAPTFAASINVNVGNDHWQDWRWRERHHNEWKMWRRHHHNEWKRWRHDNRRDWERWCNYHPYDCR